MIIVRSDIIGQVDMRLVSRPTNTCAGVDNYFIFARPTEASWFPTIRFVGTDEGFAHSRYDNALSTAKTIYEGEAA